ncbi:MAG: tRNA (adenosine(37)-N6)-threonylcarbamoyltransferase complex transferase subunit TsaD, partial [Lentisphaerae bacterium]|nr:tRNA (adenosine(37)-N6)-threonylcarbamoyltransferase complex transferase subunit TsaD [Lentisphaerota bacterium]
MMNVLGIETSCDETAAAVVGDDRQVLSNVVFSQVDLHGPYGGVVPEIASRSHCETLPGVVAEAVSESGVGWDGIDAVAFTHGPGLASSLLVGIAMGKGLALALGKPACAVNHLEAHLHSVFLAADVPSFDDSVPFVALVVSGGHTLIVRVDEGGYTLLGRTVDDAAGEAFDKGANLLGLGYPGGPAIQVAAEGGDPRYIRFPRGRQRKDKGLPEGLSAEMCFSFSGVKTSLMYHLKKNPLSGDLAERASLAASYQEAIVDALVTRCEGAMGGVGTFALAGGVALNARLRERLTAVAADNNVRLLMAPRGYCADNAAMIA